MKLLRSQKKVSKESLSFVVQKHQASHLHYDFRLEHKGILLSWAIPKGPSLDPKVKRLAVKVEDHALSYGDFEGVIPEGSYGAGTVKIWDKGIYQVRGATTKKEAEKKNQEGLKKGHLELHLEGKKLRGDFDLIQLKNTDKDNLWILVKRKTFPPE